MDNVNSDKPIPLDNTNSGNEGVPHSPLDLGSSRPVELNKVPKPQPRPQPVDVPKVNMTANSNTQTFSSGKITGVKSFFSKLHAGSLDFLDGLINDWIKENPNLDIKLVQTTVGDIQGKKTEPNIIITIWY